MISPIFTEEYSTPPPKFSLIHKLLFERFFWSFTVEEMKHFWGHQISSSLGSQFPITRGNPFSAGEQVTSHRSDRITTTHWDVLCIIRFLKKHVKTFWVDYLMRYLHQNVYTVFLARVSKCLLRKIEYKHVEKIFYWNGMCKVTLASSVSEVCTSSAQFLHLPISSSNVPSWNL